jgi:DNA-binding transcriptional ArsR family regulator
VENDKSFFRRLYEALEAQETRDNTDATSPTRGSEDLFMATDPPGDGGGENRVSKHFTYQKEALGIPLPGKDHEAFLSSVGGPLLSPAKQRVEEVCQADGDGPQKLLDLLQEIGRSVLPPGNRELRRKVGTVVFMVPLEMLALNLGVSRQTVYSWRKKLEEKGLVATDVLREKVDGEYRAIGTLWAVRLRPGKARLTLDDYIYPWRNLATDIANGVLSYAWVRAFEQHGIRPTLDVLIFWAQGRRVLPNTKTVAVDLGLILVLPEVEEAKRPALITLIATHIANVLDDHRSRRFFAGLLWAVVRGEIPAQYLFSLLVRVIRDYTEGFLTKPGAYLVKTLKTIEREAS